MTPGPRPDMEETMSTTDKEWEKFKHWVACKHELLLCRSCRECGREEPWHDHKSEWMPTPMSWGYDVGE